MKYLITLLALSLLLGTALTTKLDYENCRKQQCNSSNLCGTDTTCQKDLNTFYSCYSSSLNCQNVYSIWTKMKDQSIVPSALSSCITDCSGPYTSSQVNSYFSCLKNTCLPLGSQTYSSSQILSLGLSFIALIFASF